MIIPGPFPKPGLVPAYLVEWVDEAGVVVRTQTASEFPLTQLRTSLTQRMVAKVLGKDFHAAHDNLLDMLDKADPKLGSRMREQRGG